jgi:hypothetical protein
VDNEIYAEPMLAMWQCAATWGRANMEAFARMWGLTSPRSDSLATLSLVMDRQMRAPSFLRLLQHGVRLMSARNWLELTHALLGFPDSLLKRRVSP